MKKRQTRRSKLLAFSLILSVFCCSAEGSEIVIKSIELKLLWEKKVSFEYGLIEPDPSFSRFVAEKSQGNRNQQYVYLDSEFKKVFEIKPSIYGIGNGRKSLHEHPDYVTAKKAGVLYDLKLEVTDFAVPSPNYDYLGVFKIYYNSKDEMFDRKFELYKVDRSGKRQLLWEKDPVCPETSVDKVRRRDANSWECCLDDCVVANNGNTMLISGSLRSGMAKRLLFFNREGTILSDEEACGGAMPLVGFSMVTSGAFKFGKWTANNSDTDWYFYSSEGIRISKQEFNLATDTKQSSITKMHEVLAQENQSSEKITAHEFLPESETKLLFLSAKNGRGHSVTLYDAAEGKDVWTFENKKDGSELLGVPRISRGGELIVIAREQLRQLNTSENKEASNRPLERLFLNCNGDIIHTTSEFKRDDSLEISADGKKLLAYDSAGNIRLYQIIVSY